MQFNAIEVKLFLTGKYGSNYVTESLEWDSSAQACWRQYADSCSVGHHEHIVSPSMTELIEFLSAPSDNEPPEAAVPIKPDAPAPVQTPVEASKVNEDGGDTDGENESDGNQ